SRILNWSVTTRIRPSRRRSQCEIIQPRMDTNGHEELRREWRKFSPIDSFSRQLVLIRVNLCSFVVYFSHDETLQGHCRNVAQPRDWRGRQNPVASAGRLQVVQKNDDGQHRRDGTQDLREPRPAAVQPQKHGAHAAPAAAHQAASGNLRAIPRMAWRTLSQARLPVSFHEAGGKTGNGNPDFQLAEPIESRRVSQ